MLLALGRHAVVRARRTLDAAGPAFAWADRPTERTPAGRRPSVPGTVTELPRQASAFIRTLAAQLARGAAFFVDYGFPEHEYYHPQRTGGTLMCHRGHQADPIRWSRSAART